MRVARGVGPLGAVVVSLLGLVACGGTGSISGTVTVVGAADNSGVTVTVGSLSKTTDGAGTYTIDKLTAKVYAVSAARDGYATKTQQVTVVADKVAIANFTLDVANHKPVIVSLTAAPPTVPRAGKTTLVAMATDPDADTLSYAWALPSGWSFESVDKQNAAAVTIVAPDAPGQTATITLTVSDGKGGSASGDVVVSTSSPNGPAITTVSAVPSLVHRGGTINLAVSATDPDKQKLTYDWSAPSGWTLTPSTDGTSATLVAPAQTAQTATITVVVVDTSGLSAAGSVLVGTADNLPPMISNLSADVAQVLPGGVVHAVVSANDPDGDPLTYTWTSTDSTWMIVGTGTTVTVNAPQQSGGSTSLKVTVSDGIGGSVSATLLLTTTGCPAGKLNCDKNDLNGCEVDSTTVADCGACGVVCGAGEVCDHGTACRAPGVSCEQLFEDGLSLGDGIYFLKPPGAGPDPYAVDCDMTTDGGGWTGFYANKNGSPNSFSHFEQTAADCADPLNRCLRRIPGSAGTPEVMASCGASQLGFFGSAPVFDYLINGNQQYWQPLLAARAIGGGGNPAFATEMYTGGGSDTGFIIGDGNPADSFGSSHDVDPVWNFCNGVADTSSALKLFYRSRVDHFVLSPDAVNQQTGIAFSVTVRAVDTQGVVVQDYSGGVHFTSSDGSATLPGDYGFLPGDHGVHTFTNAVTLAVASGSPTVTATDKKRSSVTATTTLHIAALGSAAQPAVDCLGIVEGGAAGVDGVYWLTDGVTPFRSYCDMSTDGGGWTAVFVGKNGQANVFDHFELTALDCPDPWSQCLRRIPSGVASPEIIAGCGAARLGFFPSSGALDYFENGVSSFWQQLNAPRDLGGGPNLGFAQSIWTGDGGGDYGFIISDTNTSDTFASSYGSNNAWDYCNGNNDNTSRMTLLYRSRVDHLELVSAVRNADLGGPFDLSVRAVNRDGSTNADYRGTIHFTSTDGAATLPADYSFVAGDGGVHLFSGGATLNTAGAQSVTATDTVRAALTVTQSFHAGGLGSPGNPATSCLAILNAGDASGDGRYMLTDGVTPYAAYCDMGRGGWTLLLSANGNSNYWGNDSGNWASTSVTGAAPVVLGDVSGTDYKATAYSAMNTNAVKLCLADADHCYTFNHNMAIALRTFYATAVSYVPYANNVLFFADTGSDSVRTDFLAALGVNAGTAACYWVGINHPQMGGGIGLMGDGNAGCANMGPQGGNFWLDDYAMGLGMNSCNDGSCAPTNVPAAGISEGVFGSNTWTPWFVFGR